MLRRYRHVMWGNIDFFDVFTIKEVTREQNAKVDSLVVVVTILQPCESLISRESKIKIIFQPSFANNFERWQVLNNDAQIIIFMNNLQEFVGY